MIILKQNGSSDCVIGLPFKNMQVHKQRTATLHESAKYKSYFQFSSRKYMYLVQCLLQYTNCFKKKSIIINDIRLSQNKCCVQAFKIKVQLP